MQSGRARDTKSHGEDLELVERLVAGDRSAFDTFGERYFAALYRFARSRLRGDGELARDIVQTTIAKALAKIETYRGTASLSTWLCSCCTNEIRMHFRKRQSAPLEVELDEQVRPLAEASADPAAGRAGAGRAGMGPNPEAALLDREQALQVHMTLDELPEHYAQALEWKYVERLPVREIGSRLGVRPKAAESLLTRARQAFRTAYGSLRVEPDAGASGSGANGMTRGRGR